MFFVEHVFRRKFLVFFVERVFRRTVCFSSQSVFFVEQAVFFVEHTVFFVEQTVFFVEQFFNKYVLQKNKKRQKNDKSSFFLEKYRYSQDERLETLLLRPVPRPIFQKIWLFSHQFFTSDALELVFRRFRPFLKF